jgi:hypothetical protein
MRTSELGTLKRDGLRSNRRALGCCLSMFFLKNRFSLFRIMLYWRLGGFMVATAVRSAGLRFVLQMAIALSFCTFAAESQAYTAEQQQACMGDAFRLCGSEIPYVDRVAACMVRQQSQLSPGCRVYFRPEPGDPSATASAIRPAHIRRWHKPRKHIQHDDT